MSKPSDVVGLIERSFERGIPGTLVNGMVVPHGQWEFRQAGIAGAIIKAVDGLDDRLLRECLGDVERGMLSEALESLRSAHSTWSLGDKTLPIVTHHVVTIYGLLKACNNEATPVAVADLTYIKDPKLREDVARDLDSLPRLLADDQWKAATVIAGSVVEALLLAKVEEQHAEAVALAAAKGWKKERKPIEPEDFGLERLIQAARDLGIVTDQEAKVCSVAQYYRNAIHPGVARIRNASDNGTALLAMGAAATLVAKWKDRSR